jgi:hypothetical protein
MISSVALGLPCATMSRACGILAAGRVLGCGSSSDRASAPHSPESHKLYRQQHPVLEHFMTAALFKNLIVEIGMDRYPPFLDLGRLCSAARFIGGITKAIKGRHYRAS